jgi:Fic family protein
MDKFKDKLKRVDKLKAEIDTLTPLDPAQIKNIDEWYTVELTYTSNALEGNTLSRQETAQIIEKNITVEGKTINEHLEAKNHAAAFEFIRGLLKSGSIARTITLGDILDIHARVLAKIDDVNAGKLRTVPVRIAGSTAVMPNPTKVPELMQEFISWLSENHTHPVEKAIEAHYQFVTIHPFTDGNGRTARLVMNLILLRDGYRPLIIPKEGRRAYVESLEKAQTKGDRYDYNAFMLDRLIESLEEYLKMATGT